MSSAIFTTSSTLMHASLAYISPELRTFDAIIRLHSQKNILINESHSRPTLLSIPTELLLLIRSHLLPIITTHLLALSTSALTQYESSLRALLCSECLAYNRDIFGPDIWQWEQFSGPCACADIKAGIKHPSHFISRNTPSSSQVNPKQFKDAHHWLEAHLSHESPRLTGAPSSTIWDIVSDVLGDFGCEALRHSSANHNRFMSLVSLRAGGNISRWDYQKTYVFVVPLASALRRCEQEQTQQSRINGEQWRGQVILNRVDRNLGLSSSYEDLTEEFISTLDPCLSLLALVYKSKPTRPSHCIIDPTTSLPLLVKLTTAIVAACISLLLTPITLFVTILCYYSRPGAMRVL